jgi:hypothetical protein
MKAWLPSQVGHIRAAATSPYCVAVLERFYRNPSFALQLAALAAGSRVIVNAHHMKRGQMAELTNDLAGDQFEAVHIHQSLSTTTTLALFFTAVLTPIFDTCPAARRDNLSMLASEPRSQCAVKQYRVDG